MLEIPQPKAIIPGTTINENPRTLRTQTFHRKSPDLDPKKIGKISDWDPEFDEFPAISPSILHLGKIFDGKVGAIESEISRNQCVDDLTIRATRSKRFMDAIEPDIYKIDGPKSKPPPHLQKKGNKIATSGIEQVRNALFLIHLLFQTLWICGFWGMAAWRLYTEPNRNPYSALGPAFTAFILSAAMAYGPAPNLIRPLEFWEIALPLFYEKPKNIWIRFMSINVVPFRKYAKATKSTASNVLRIAGWSEPLLEDGKSRVRWQCVSLKTLDSVPEQ